MPTHYHTKETHNRLVKVGHDWIPGEVTNPIKHDFLGTGTRKERRAVLKQQQKAAKKQKRKEGK
jgi:hypothetical protein